jgi:archaeosine synthase
MTEYFEVLSRDGAARVAELRLADSLVTPALVDDVLADAGGVWPEHRPVPEGDDDALTVLPHRGLPAGTADEVAESFAVDYPDVDYPSAAVVHSEHVEACGADAYALSDVQGFLGHARGVKDALLRVKDAIPEDAAVYLSGAATPRNVAVLAYAGVDLFDADRVVALGTQGRYLTTDENHFLEDLDELPCACEACRQPRETFDRSDCVDHNVAVLEAELARVRRRIRDGRLRDYVEGQARQDQWLTALVRELDQQYGYLEARTPVYRNAHMDATTEDTLNRVEIQRFAQRVTERYRNRFDAPLVLVPCSATKPYSESQSHYQFREIIQYRAHVASITSPIGVVPQELELTYPAQHYDTVVTGEWTAGEVGFVANVLERYLATNDYPRVIAHVPGDYREVVERALANHPDVDVEFTVADHPTTDESLAALGRALEGESAYGKRERQRNTVKAIADYQFGAGAGDDLFGEFAVTSRYPKLQVRADEPPSAGDDQNAAPQLATMVPNYGTLSFTLRGARRWLESPVPTKRVEIDGFVPHGSVLAPGVLHADDDIREGDEVVIEGPKAFAVGRAQTNGVAMVEATRGEACTVRHVEER